MNEGKLGKCDLFNASGGYYKSQGKKPHVEADSNKFSRKEGE